MSKILINISGSDVILDDVGVTIAFGLDYTVPPQDYPQFAASSDAIVALSTGLLTLNDGGNDITDISQAVDILKGWPIQSTTDDSVEEPFFFDYDDIPVGSGPFTLFSVAVGPGQTLDLKRVSLSCRIEAKLQIVKNGSSIGNLRTGAAQPMSNFDWRPDHICVENDVIDIILTKRAGAPDTDVGVHVMGVTTTL